MFKALYQEENQLEKFIEDPKFAHTLVNALTFYGAFKHIAVTSKFLLFPCDFTRELRIIEEKQEGIMEKWLRISRTSRNNNI